MAKPRVGFSAGGSVSSEAFALTLKELEIDTSGHDCSERVYKNSHLSAAIMSPQLCNKAAYLKFLGYFVSECCDHYIPFLDDELVVCHALVESHPELANKFLLADIATVNTCNDKLLTKSVLSSAGIPVVGEAVRPPAFLKPRFGSGGKFGLRLQKAESLEAATIIANNEHLLLEEYIEGPILSADTLWSINGQLLSVAQRIRPKGSGVSTLSLPQQDSRITQSINKAIRSAGEILRFKGMASFQFLVKEEQKCLLLEINPRMGGSISHSHYLGSNILIEYLKLALNTFTGKACMSTVRLPQASQVSRFFYDKIN